MALLQQFLDPTSISLKICGVTQLADVQALIDLGVPALGFNFWPHSKRYISPDKAADLLSTSAKKTLRVGVFVNADPELPRQLLLENKIDLAQFHGDEDADYCRLFAQENLPFIKAISASPQHPLQTDSLPQGVSAILLDTPAPGLYGGTGESFDWKLAVDFIQNHPQIPVLLAGGITPQNAADAIREVHPAALDIASGAESSPGIKDLSKVEALLDAINSPSS